MPPLLTPLQQECLQLIKTDMNDPRVRGQGWLRPSFVFAHIQIESDWDPDVLAADFETTGSVGLMQVTRQTAKAVGVPGDQKVPANSILAGMRYLAACMATLRHWLGGKQPPYRLVCIAFNEGPGNVEKGRPDTPYYTTWLAAQKKWAWVDK